MRLQRLVLRNFKGIRDFAFEPNGENATIFGDNATGKTTLADAFTWLLFDKDSNNRKEFDIKTLDKKGEPAHGLEHEVEATLGLDGGSEITLSKIYKENWTKKRGSATKSFTGHTTDYYVDGVPIKKADYTARVAEIADEEQFKLLTSPGYFNEVFHWQDRRQILLDVCGDVSDSEVIASDKALEKLPEILGKRKLDDHRKVIAARRSEINKELERIPTRIDEVTRGLPELPPGNKGLLETQLAAVRETRKAKEQEKVRIESGGEIADKQRRANEMESKLQVIERRVWGELHEAAEAERKRKRELNEQKEALIPDITRKQAEANDASTKARQAEIEMAALRERWRETDAQTFEHSQDETCPSCGHAIPVDHLEAAREKALEAFNAHKAKHLEEINEVGKQLKAQAEELERIRTERLAEAERLASDLNALKVEQAQVDARIEALQAKLGEDPEDPEYQKLQAGKALLEEGIATLRENSAPALAKVAGELQQLDKQIGAVQAALAAIEQWGRGEERIEELKADEKRLNTEFEKLEGELYLMERFTMAQAEMLESKINGRFETVQFRMFNQLINGGVEPACITLVGGVPYETALNTAAKVNAGLEIINVLADHYGFRAPVWVDRCESVTKLVHMDSQVIRLVVNEADKKLRVEHERAAAIQKEAVSVG